jgi:cobalt/nickel transport protein
MKKVLLLAGGISVAAAFWASTHPDGLDKVAETFGFAHKAVEHQTLMTGYALPFLPAGPISTAVAGMFGVLIVFSLISGLKLLFRAR